MTGYCEQMNPSYDSVRVDAPRWNHGCAWRRAVNRVGEFMGVPVFAETGAPARPEVVNLPVRPGCEFQPYQLRQQVRARG